MGSNDALISDVQRLAQPLCAELGLDVVQVNANAHQATMHIQVFADKPEGGIGMEECARLNRALAAQLDLELGLGDNYTLEVSSPGLDRLLSGHRDLRRVLGRSVQVFLKEPVGGKREVSGVLRAVCETQIVVEGRKGEVLVPMDKIDKAKQIIN